MKFARIFLVLFLAVATVGFTACTGSDGSDGSDGAMGKEGKEGKEGPEGPEGKPGDVDSHEFNYPFLKSWGKTSGKMACNDSLLTGGNGVFPGPSSLTALEEEERSLLSEAKATKDEPNRPNGYVQVKCSADVFESVPNPNLDEKDGGDLIGLGDPSDNGLLFVKTHRGKKGGDMVTSGEVPASSVSPATVKTTTTTTSVGGKFFADMSRDSDEEFYRSELYHDCGIGTEPSEIRGEWRGVQTEEIKKNQEISGLDKLVKPVLGSGVKTTAKEICIRLDSLPGAVKCYVRKEVVVIEEKTTAGEAIPIPVGSVAEEMKDQVGTTEDIAIYEGGDLTVVMPLAASTGDNKGLLTPDDSKGKPKAIFISIGSIGDGIATSQVQAGKLCNLFEEAKP